MFTIPLAIVAACVLAAAGALYIDQHFGETIDGWPVVLGATVAGGRAIASAVAGATVTVAAIVFSITALSTQMAASTYSLRAMSGFFEDRLQQSVIGLVVGTFTYSIVILASLSNAIIDGGEANPSVSVSFAIILGVASAIGIVAYINHSLRRMQIDSVVRRIAEAAVRSIERHLPERPHSDPPDGSPPSGEPEAVAAEKGGWVVDLAVEEILDAVPPGTTVRVEVRVGEAVAPNDRIATLWPGPGAAWKGAGRLRSAIVTAAERSIETDPTFGIRQLVDIALRALSPGVNDPTTAVDVIHHLKTPVRRVLLAESPRRVFADEQGRRVFLSEAPGRSDYVHAAFSEIRLAATGQPFVLGALIEVLQELRHDLQRRELGERTAALDEELELTVSGARRSGLPEPDLARILRRLGEPPSNASDT